MAVAWFIAPYIVGRHIPGRPTRQCGMDAYSTQIAEAGGSWAEVEVLGNRAIVRVQAPPAVLAALAARPELRRLPTDQLDAPLAALSRTAREGLVDELTDAGYSPAEIRERFPDASLSTVTLRDVLAFLARRRRRPRWDEQAQELVLDGDEIACDPAALREVLG